MEQMAIAGSRAMGASEKNATPLGSDKTPAPIILLARLKVEVAMVASPPFGFGTSLVAAASRLRKTLDFLCLMEFTDVLPVERTFNVDAKAKPDALVAHSAIKSTELKRILTADDDKFNVSRAVTARYQP